jgi:DHA2 family multidrug resistance protein-like MFS transporter
VNASVQGEITKSFAGAESVAGHYPQYASQITAAAKQSFLDGGDWAYIAGLIAVLLGAVLVFFCFPRKDDEQAMLARFHEEDSAAPQQRPLTVA